MEKKSGSAWPIAIVATFVIFAAGLFVLIGFMVSEDLDLVSEDYYQAEIEFQDKIDKRNRAVKDGRVVEVVKEGTLLRLDFPDANKENTAGEIYLYRSAGSADDLRFDVEPDAAGGQIIDISDLPPGNWIVKIEWKLGDVEYFTEKPLAI